MSCVPSRSEACPAPGPRGTSKPLEAWVGPRLVSRARNRPCARALPGLPRPSVRWPAHPFSLQARVVAADGEGGFCGAARAARGVGVSSRAGRPLWSRAVGSGGRMASGHRSIERDGFSRGPGPQCPGTSRVPPRRAPSVSSVTVVADPSRWGALRVDRVGYGEHPRARALARSRPGSIGAGSSFWVRSWKGPRSQKRGRLVIPPGFVPG
jgi:hypothetical protein